LLPSVQTLARATHALGIEIGDLFLQLRRDKDKPVQEKLIESQPVCEQ
jgi:hypothetical protein